jgi:hypothetical protein
VVARYHESLDWLKREPYCWIGQVVVYNKGPPLNPADAGLSGSVTVVQLPNVGRCDHTFLYHILRCYDDLATVTVFVSGELNDPRKGPKIRRVVDAALRTMDTVLMGGWFPSGPLPGGGGPPAEGVRAAMSDFQLDEWTSSNERNRVDVGGDGRMERAALRPFGRWYDAFWPDNPRVRIIAWYSIFAAHRRHIRQHPRSHYRRIMEGVRHHPNPEVGHYIERAWGAVFWPYEPSCVYPD